MSLCSILSQYPGLAPALRNRAVVRQRLGRPHTEVTRTCHTQLTRTPLLHYAFLIDSFCKVVEDFEAAIKGDQGLEPELRTFIALCKARGGDYADACGDFRRIHETGRLDRIAGVRVAWAVNQLVN